MNALPLIVGSDLELPIAWRAGVPISRRRYLADVNALCALVPGAGPMLNVTADRYHFAVGLGAAMLRGQDNLMPPNHTTDMVSRLHGLFPSTYALADEAAPPVRLPMVWHPRAALTVGKTDAVPHIDADLLVAQVLTSGSTGAPVPHPKRWGLLVDNTRAGVQRLAEQMGRSDLAGVTLVATVPPQHMYGFESTVLVALLGGAAFDVERPFFPADIASALARAPRPRMLVTTPFHLKALLDSGLPLPPIDLTVCATAPLSPQLAARAEAALAAPLMEIYGCTEAGQVASRRTTDGPEWHTYESLRLTGDGEHSVVQDGHVPQPVLLADVLEVMDAQTFRLLGRSNDLINIAGKRSSLSHLNYHLNSIAGVHDGSFWLPPDEPSHGGVKRLTAFVVAPGIAAAALHEHVVGALRQRVDAAFLPRRVLAVPALPREPTGKLPTGLFDLWAGAVLAQASQRAQSLNTPRG